MGLLEDVGSIVAKYASGGGSQQDVEAHFHQVVDSADSATLSPGIAEALRSDQTPPFAQMVAQLFGNASADQKAAMLNALLAAAPPSLQATLLGLIPGAGTLASLTSNQVAGVSPDAVTRLAEQVEQHNPGVIDRMGSFYAQHPALIKTLGSAAMMIAMKKMAERRT